MAVSVSQRIEKLSWAGLLADLHERGFAITPSLLTASECNDLIATYPEDGLFRNHIVMARYRFGSGDYKYFADPLPGIVREIRTSFYERLSTVANRWNELLGLKERFPARHEELVKLCREKGQLRPTPLLLHYEAGDYNCLHQDLYVQIAFPLQLTCFLSSKTEYSGGEFVLVEQQPRAQSKVEVLSPEQGQVLMFATRYRPVKGTRGYYRANVRHGVSRVRSGIRYTLGVPMHEAE